MEGTCYIMCARSITRKDKSLGDHSLWLFFILLKGADLWIIYGIRPYFQVESGRG